MDEGPRQRTQRTRCQVRIALRAAEPLAESLLVSDTLSCSTEDVGLRGVSFYCATGLARHTHRLDHISEQPNPVKHLHPDVKRLLYPGFPR